MKEYYLFSKIIENHLPNPTSGLIDIDNPSWKSPLEPYHSLDRDYNEWEGFYHNYLDRPLPYRIKLPDNYDPQQSYPVMIWGGADNVRWQPWPGVGSDSFVLNRRAVMDFFPGTWYRHDFNNFIYIMPTPVDWQIWTATSSEKPFDHPLHDINAWHGRGFYASWVKAVKDLIKNLINKTTVGYKKHEINFHASDIMPARAEFYNSTFSGKDTTYQFPNIDENKIFIGGYSGGAGTALQSLPILSDILAGVFALGGWFEGYPYKMDENSDFPYYGNNLDPKSPNYNPFAEQYLEDLAEQCMHIPILISDGTRNTMETDVHVFANKMDEKCKEHGYDNKLIFINPIGGYHKWSWTEEDWNEYMEYYDNPSAWIGDYRIKGEAAPLNDNNYFDSEYHFGQELNERTENLMNTTEWINSISKETNQTQFTTHDWLKLNVEDWEYSIIGDYPSNNWNSLLINKRQIIELDEIKTNIWYKNNRTIAEISRIEIDNISLEKNIFYDNIVEHCRLRNNGTNLEIWKPLQKGVF